MIVQSVEEARAVAEGAVETSALKIALVVVATPLEPVVRSIETLNAHTTVRDTSALSGKRDKSKVVDLSQTQT